MNRRAKAAMEGAIRYVCLNPGCTKADVTSLAGWPYTALQRAIDAGLIRADRPNPRGPCRLYTAGGETAGGGS